MRSRLIKLQLKTGETVNVLPTEVKGLREAGLLLEEDPDKLVKQNEPEREDPPEEEIQVPEQKEKPGYKLPVLTQGERRARIKQAKKLNRQGYSQREIARQLNVSHTAVQKWLGMKKSKWQLLATF